MIARITGTLVELNSESNLVLVETGPLVYELMIPGYAVTDLSGKLHQEITLHTLEYYEGSSMGNQFVPRMIGFPHAGDKHGHPAKEPGRRREDRQRVCQAARGGSHLHHGGGRRHQADNHLRAGRVAPGDNGGSIEEKVWGGG